MNALALGQRKFRFSVEVPLLGEFNAKNEFREDLNVENMPTITSSFSISLVIISSFYVTSVLCVTISTH